MILLIGVNGMDDKRIDVLYRLLDDAEKRGDTEGAAALRWAIFTLEQQH